MECDIPGSGSIQKDIGCLGIISHDDFVGGANAQIQPKLPVRFTEIKDRFEFVTILFGAEFAHRNGALNSPRPKVNPF